jgi:hypothetical protein
MGNLTTDIYIAGGGVGGCACAIAACEAGLRVIVSEESDWIGGQFTSQATPPDEHGWIEHFGCTRNYRKFRNRVRDHYRNNYQLTPAALSDLYLNPGNGWVSPLCAEPRAFLAVFEGWLQEYVDRGLLTILRRTVPVSAETIGDGVGKVLVQYLENGDQLEIAAKYFVDATELGDLLPLTNTDFVTGSESKAETGEPSAGEISRPNNSQAFSVCFAMSYHEGEDHTIDKPGNYDQWKTFVPSLDPPWPGPLLSLTGLSPRSMQPVTYNFEPNREPNQAFAGLWTYRRILDRTNFREDMFDSDVTLVNYPQIDFLGADLCSTTEKEKVLADAESQSLSFFYYLQSELGYKGLKLRGDITGTKSGLAKMPYIRESRRIKAMLTIKEQHVAAVCRPGKKLAERFEDSVGIGFYRIDLHPTFGGDNYIDVESLPFQIPLGALVPESKNNLLPACKNIGSTHITNGCYRLHPIEWNIGEAIGNLVAFCLRENKLPGEVWKSRTLTVGLQSQLVKQGFELEWPEDLNLEEGDPHRHAK